MNGNGHELGSGATAQSPSQRPTLPPSRALSPAPGSQSARHRFPSSPRGHTAATDGGAPSPGTPVFTEAPTTSTSAGGSGPGTVTSERTKLLKETCSQQETALAGLQNEQRRLAALRTATADVQRSNDELRLRLAAHDVRALREENAQLQAKAEEVARLQAAAVQLQGTIDRRGAVQAELDALKPALADAQALENELRELRGVEAGREALRREVGALQPKVEMVHKMKRQLVQLQSEAEEAEALQAQVAAMSVQADKLPNLKVQHAKKQASSAESRQLERQVAELEKQEAQYGELSQRLALLQANVADFEDLKMRVDSASEAARVAEALAGRLGELRRTAELLPALQAEHDRLADAAAQAQVLDKAVTALMPQAAALQSVKYQHQQLTAVVQEVANMQARVGELKDVESQRLALLRQLEDLGVRDEGASYADVRGMERAVSHRMAPAGQAAAAPLTGLALASSSTTSTSQLPPRLHGSSSGRSVRPSLDLLQQESSWETTGDGGGPYGSVSLSGLGLDDGAAMLGSPLLLPQGSGGAPVVMSQRQQAVEALKRQLSALNHQSSPAGLPPLVPSNSSKRRSSAGGDGSGGGAVPKQPLTPSGASPAGTSGGGAAGLHSPPLRSPGAAPPPPSSSTPPAMPSVRDLASMHEAAVQLHDLQSRRTGLAGQLEVLSPTQGGSPAASALRGRLAELDAQQAALQAAADELGSVEAATASVAARVPGEEDSTPSANGSGGGGGGVPSSSGGGARVVETGVVVAELRSRFSNGGDVSFSVADVSPRITAQDLKVRALEADNAHLHTSAALLPHLEREHARLTGQVEQMHALEAQLAHLQQLAAQLPALQAAVASPLLQAQAATATDLAALTASSPFTAGANGSSSSWSHPPSHPPPFTVEQRLQERLDELAPLEGEAVMLSAEIERLAPLSEAIGVVRAEHGRLVALLHEQNALEDDSEVLALQVAVIDGGRVSADDILHADSAGPSDGGDSVDIAAEGSGSVRGVFARLRALTAERLDLLADNDALRDEIDELRERFANSVAAISKLKSLANAMDQIRRVGSRDKARSMTEGGLSLEA